MSVPVLVGVGRIISGEVIFLASPEWEQSAEEAGRLLRLYQHPIDRCVNDAQRAGWEAENARIEAQFETFAAAELEDLQEDMLDREDWAGGMW